MFVVICKLGMYLKHVHDVQVWKILTKYKIQIYCSSILDKARDMDRSVMDNKG